MTESALFLWCSEVTRTHTPPHVRCGLPLSLTWKPRPQAGDRLPEGASLLSPNLQPQSCPGASGNRARAAAPLPRSQLGLAHLLVLPSGPRSWPIAASPGPLGGLQRRPGLPPPPQLRLPTRPSHSRRLCSPHPCAGFENPASASPRPAPSTPRPSSSGSFGKGASGSEDEDGSGPQTSFSKAPLVEKSERGELWTP